MLQYSIVIAVFTALAVLVCVYIERKQTATVRKRHRCCNYLDELHGGAWYYNTATDHYEDSLTDRRLPAKDVE